MEQTTEELDGKTQKTSGRLEKSNREDDRRGVESIAESSSILGTEQSDRLATGDSRGANYRRSSRPKSSKVYLGKILERVEYLEREFLSYVHSHQSRLETRLEESKVREKNFLTVAAELKDELLAALSDEATLDSQELQTEESKS